MRSQSPPPRREYEERSRDYDDRPREREYRGRRDEGQVDANPGNNLHVSGLSRNIDTPTLQAAFAAVGRVQRANVVMDPHTRDSRGFGFVTMESSEEADAAIAALNGTMIGDRTISIEKARRGRARTPTPGKYYGPPKREFGGGDRGGGDRGGRRGGPPFRYDDRERRPRDDGGDRDRSYNPRSYDDKYARGGGERDYAPRGERSDRGGRDYERRDYDRGDRGGRDYDRGAERGGRDYERPPRRD
ncbi:RNA-binding domain-containing protein [Cylindrobasidium torrendii FP15055 ss-10]|uniref:RNA-binding domain-containing protein n=1 Tax=Cylindrobasidium torrendii FP15055 ss-10 TaxID=1314674 RepID=A0A0D7AS63_9AGAR|nr:RNA-binding domain-containing protein [Cylindrobasidium torrendii FP15055 ss-10]